MNASAVKCLKETEAELSLYKKLYGWLARKNDNVKDRLEKKLSGRRRSATPENAWWPSTMSAIRELVQPCNCRVRVGISQ
jgi:hypothetical protein